MKVVKPGEVTGCSIYTAYLSNQQDSPNCWHLWILLYLIGKQGLCRIVKGLGTKRLPSIIQIGPKCNQKCPYNRYKDDIHREERRSCEDGGRDWRKAAGSQGMPRTVGGLLKLRERREMDFSLNLRKERSPSNKLDFRVLASKTVRK